MSDRDNLDAILTDVVRLGMPGYTQQSRGGVRDRAGAGWSAVLGGQPVALRRSEPSRPPTPPGGSVYVLSTVHDIGCHNGQG